MYWASWVLSGFVEVWSGLGLSTGAKTGGLLTTTEWFSAYFVKINLLFHIMDQRKHKFRFRIIGQMVSLGIH